MGVAPAITDGAMTADVFWVTSPGAALATEVVSTTPDATSATDMSRDEIRRTVASIR